MKRFIFILLTMLLAACSNKGPEIPDGILGQKEMAAILSDIHVAQSVLSNKTKSDSLNYKTDDYIEIILKKHNVVKMDFLRSLKFYTDNPEIFHAVYDSIIVGLNRQGAED